MPVRSISPGNLQIAACLRVPRPPVATGDKSLRHCAARSRGGRCRFSRTPVAGRHEFGCHRWWRPYSRPIAPERNSTEDEGYHGAYPAIFPAGVGYTGHW
jgi:hypothetical protein